MSTLPQSTRIGPVWVGHYNSFEHIAEWLHFTLDANGSAVAIAINPEKILSAESDAQLNEIIQRADVTYADGIGVVKAIRHKTGVSLPRLPGCELWEYLMRLAAEKNEGVFLVGGKSDIIVETARRLGASGTPIVGVVDGYFNDEALVIEKIKKAQPRYVTVAMGSPKQEKFIYRCVDSGVSAIFMGVGGTYDVYTGQVPRAPQWMRTVNLEWLYRLINQPKRSLRQLKLLTFLRRMWLNQL